MHFKLLYICVIWPVLVFTGDVSQILPSHRWAFISITLLQARHLQVNLSGSHKLSVAMPQEASASEASSSASQEELSTAGDLGVLGQNSKLLDNKQLTEAQAPAVGDLHCSAMSPDAETVEEIPEKTFDELFIELRDRVPCLRGDDSASRVYILKHIISYIDNLRSENFVLSHNEDEWREEWEGECGEEWEEREWGAECEGEWEEGDGDYEEHCEAGWEEGEWEEQGEAG